MVALPLILAILFLGPAILTTVLVGLALIIGLFEFYKLMQARGHAPYRLVGLAAAALLYTDIAWKHTSAPLWPIALLALFFAALASRAPIERISDLALTLLGAIYLGGLGGTLSALRTLAPDAAGAWRVVLLFAIVMLSDTFAFFLGRAIGRHRLSPSISPAKTIEGGVAALLGGIAGAWAVRALGLPSLTPLAATLLGASVAVCGIAGDLAESLLKRWAGVKDSGTLFPGHGGMLDRLDSLLFGAPVLYYYFSCCP
ncbi:MAG: phosphatidate cytidylyltransferase [Vicinamibacteria bacterium]|nr:phosphatidate cytidylyltransferase [Vicinamibacteria bacterium]